MLQLLGPRAYGWEARQRGGGEVSMRDVSMRMPPLPMNPWLGHNMKPLLDPHARRSGPVETSAKVAVSLAAATVGAVMFELICSRRK